MMRESWLKTPNPQQARHPAIWAEYCAIKPLLNCGFNAHFNDRTGTITATNRRTGEVLKLGGLPKGVNGAARGAWLLAKQIEARGGKPAPAKASPRSGARPSTRLHTPANVRVEDGIAAARLAKVRRVGGSAGGSTTTARPRVSFERERTVGEGPFRCGVYKPERVVYPPQPY